MTDEQKAKCHKIAEHYGEEHQMLKAVEEMAELTQMLIKAMNDPPKIQSDAYRLKANLIGELADVMILTEQLVKYIADSRCADLLNDEIDAKLNRQLKRMEDESNA
jgi:hypothetical protein